MSTARTPTPWAFRVVTGDVRHHEVPGDRQHLNRTASWLVGPLARSRNQAEQDREFADRAVNSHDDLLAACKAVVSNWEYHHWYPSDTEPEHVKLCRAAVAKAEPEGGPK